MGDVVASSGESARFVEFVVGSDRLTGEELQVRIGIAGDTVETIGDEFDIAGQRRRRRESAWLVTSVGTACEGTPVRSNAPIEHHLAAIYETVSPAADELRLLNADGARVLLRVVQYIGVNDKSSSGIVIDSEWIWLLQRVGGHVDIDQYVVRGDPES